MSRVAALVVNYNAAATLADCLDSLLAQTELPAVTVVDNASSDASEAILADYAERVTVHRNSDNAGYAPTVNAFARMASTPYLLIVNPDCLLPADAVARLRAELEDHPEAALAAGLLVEPGGGEQKGSRRYLPTPRRALREALGRQGGMDRRGEPLPAAPVEVPAVGGACLLLRSSAFRAVGGFDTGFGFHFEDLDLMKRLGEAGWQMRLVPDVAVTHHGGVSSERRHVWVAWHKHRGLLRYLYKHHMRSPLTWLVVTPLVLAHLAVQLPLLAAWNRRGRP